MNIKIGTYNLAGTAWNEKVSGLKIDFQRTVVVQPHFRSDYPTIRAGDNQVATIAFQVARLHADYRAATAFMLDHGGAVPRSGRVTIEFETDSGFVRRYFEAASCQTFDGEQIGVTTLHRYQIIGTRLLSSPAQAITLSRQSTRAATGSTNGATGVSGSTGSTVSTPDDAPTAFQTFANLAELKATPSSYIRKIVFLTDPEEGVPTAFKYDRLSTEPANDVSVIEPNDGAGRYLQLPI